MVRELARLGSWSGRSINFKLPEASEDALSTLILVQGAHGGRVLGVLDTPAAQAKGGEGSQANPTNTKPPRPEGKGRGGVL